LEEARIAAYKVPEAIRFLPDLPKGPTGKVLASMGDHASHPHCKVSRDLSTC
jgi:acyl-coenzyme A synthetase/AMP-(fatty) acid ligase